MFNDENVSHNDEVVIEEHSACNSDKESESLYTRSLNDSKMSEFENENY